jgi:two-component system CheB/CheR fusion protein
VAERERAWLEIVCTPGGEDAPEGRPEGAIVLVRDVTADVRREEALAASVEAERSSAADLARQLEALREINRRLLRDNDELAAANAELRGANEELLVANEEVQAATEEVETLNEELQATNEELETLNEELQATVEELNTTNDDMQARAVEVQEVTVNLEEQRRSAETERARLATVIEAMPDAILVVDRTGRTILRNGAHQRLLESGMEGAEPPFDEEELRRRTAAGEEFALPFVVTGQGGRRRWFEAYGRPVPAEMGIGDGGILVVHDTTDVSLRRVQQEFVGIVAHELRTPLTALRGYLQILSRQAAGAPDRPLRLAAEQADRLHRMVEELFDVTRVERGRLVVRREPHRLADVLEQTIEIASGISERHRIAFAPEDRDIVASVDGARLQQVVLNLLMNAIVHAPDAAEIEVRLRRMRRRAEIEVEDHGPGITPEDQDALFAPFEQGYNDGRRTGLGLGLYIAREIVAAHGGTIDVDSAPGQGTTFSVRLPLEDGSSASPREPRRRSTRQPAS